MAQPGNHAVQCQACILAVKITRGIRKPFVSASCTLDSITRSAIDRRFEHLRSAEEG